jgi:hypothetical protein
LVTKTGIELMESRRDDALIATKVPSLRDFWGGTGWVWSYQRCIPTGFYFVDNGQRFQLDAIFERLKSAVFRQKYDFYT